MRIAVRNITVGMKFEVVSHDKSLHLGMTDEEEGFFNQKNYNPPIGTILVITKAAHKIYGSQRIQFTVESDTQEWSAFAGMFIKNTKLLDGQKVVETKVDFNPISSGPFNGYDLELHDVKYGEIGIIEFTFKLLGEAEGIRKGILSTKHINTIKKSPGFREKMIKFILDNVSQNEDVINKLIDDASQSDSWHDFYKDSSMRTSYIGGKIRFDIVVFEDLETIKNNIYKMVEFFVQSNTTSENMYDKKMDPLQVLVLRTLAEEN